MIICYTSKWKQETRSVDGQTLNSATRVMLLAMAHSAHVRFALLFCSVVQLFFHPLLIHGSGRNLSAGYRKAISCHYASTHCGYTEMAGTLQEDIAKEIEAMAKRKGVEVSFNDVWRFKSRLIQGKEDTL